MTTRVLWTAAVVACCGLLLGGRAMAIEEPAYQVKIQDGAFEVRTYGPRIVAETVVPGSLSEASNAGFRRVAGYIFGRNKRREGGSTSIAMTAPVTVSQSTKIEMTAPVTTRPEQDGYRLQFVMPAEYTMATLPVPLDPTVHLSERPATTYAVIRFSGLCGESKVAERTTALQNWIAQHHYAPTGVAELARYDPPWQLPFWRRNEILIPIAALASP
jgi:SOUL heme-binding protein